MEQTFTTPMMKQYEEIKKQYQDCLLFYRMGDFYELFLEDAHIGAKILDITLTSRAKGRDGRIPMAGVPYHAVDAYLARLVKAGHRVAICEQMSEPSKKGLVEREVIRVVTPGTMLDEKALEKKEHNYIVSIVISEFKLGIAAADVSTGDFLVSEIGYSKLDQILRDELGRISPSECILHDQDYNNPDMLKLLRQEQKLNITRFPGWDQYSMQAEKNLKEHFAVSTLEGFGLAGKPYGMQAAAALLGYLQETQKNTVQHIRTIRALTDDDTLLMDRSTMINLELFSTIREHDTKGSLITLLDQTTTAMGGRLLRNWIKKPLTKKEDITERYDSVEELIENGELRANLKIELECVADIERMISRLTVGLGNARDIVNVSSSLEAILKIKSLLQTVHSPLLHKLNNSINKQLENLTRIIRSYLVSEPPVSIKEGGMIQPGIDERLDQLRATVGGSREWIANMEIEERKRTSISSLKVRYNKVFGFYIEISKANLHLIPGDYMRKQTLVGGERFITPELKKQEEIILTAEETIHDLEYTLFLTILKTVTDHTQFIQEASHAIAILDNIVSFADTAVHEHYTRPKLLYSGEMRIKQGRHPVVEKLLTTTQFVPNDVTLDNINQQLLIITGPNMAGKSVFIRQVAIIVLMAQIGSFVPAKQAHLSLVDRIFVRSGASDVITSGLSTFMVEMVETAYILRHATHKSLIVMDEIGRGTSTYDGISLAWAIAEFIVTHEKIPAKTLFATHYHELQALEKTYPKKIKNFHMGVIEEHGTPVFLHSLLPGGASASFGVAVAKMAGVPPAVITRAKQLLTELEATKHGIDHSLHSSTEKLPSHPVLDKLKTINIHTMTPLQALNVLSEVQQDIQTHENNSSSS